MKAKLATGIGYEFVGVIPVNPDDEMPYEIHLHGKTIRKITPTDGCINKLLWKRLIVLLNERLEANPSYVWDGVVDGRVHLP